MNEHGIAVVGEDDGLVLGEERVELLVAEPVRMLGLRLELHEIDDVDDADLQARGSCARSRSTAASVSSVGTSPQQAMTTSGSPPDRCSPSARCRAPRRSARWPRPCRATAATAACRRR